MKLRHSLSIFGLVAMLGLGVGVGLASMNQEVKEARAVGASGKITIDCTGGDWSTNAGGQKLSVKFTDGGENVGWGSLVTTSQYVYLAEVPYDLSFTPTKMTAYRYNPSLDEEDWEADKTTSVWNKTSELDFTANGNIIIGAWDEDHNSATVGYWGIAGKSAGTSYEWTDPLAMFTGAKKNGSNHVEYYGEFTFTQWEEFLIHEGESYYKTATFSDYVDDSEWGEHGGNIQYQAAEDITIRIYFDRNNGSIYITDPVHADADEWAQDLLGSNCTDTKNNWAALSTSYAAYVTKYDTAFSNIFVNEAHVDHLVDVTSYVSKAVQRYDYVLERFGRTSYTDFIGRVAAGKVTPLNINTVQESTNSSTNFTLVVIVASSVAVLAIIGGYFYFRKRKEDK